MSVRYEVSCRVVMTLGVAIKHHDGDEASVFQQWQHSTLNNHHSTLCTSLTWKLTTQLAHYVSWEVKRFSTSKNEKTIMEKCEEEDPCLNKSNKNGKRRRSGWSFHCGGITACCFSSHTTYTVFRWMIFLDTNFRPESQVIQIGGAATSASTLVGVAAWLHPLDAYSLACHDIIWLILKRRQLA